MGSDTGMRCSNYNTISCEKCGPNHEPEMAFVQWYEIMDDQKLCIDKMDKTLGCIRRRWQQGSCEGGKISSAAEYDLIVVGSIRGLAHVVKRNFSAVLLDRSLSISRSAKLLSGKEEDWPLKLFYVYRFFNMPIGEWRMKKRKLKQTEIMWVESLRTCFCYRMIRRLFFWKVEWKGT